MDQNIFVSKQTASMEEGPLCTWHAQATTIARFGKNRSSHTGNQNKIQDLKGPAMQKVSEATQKASMWPRQGEGQSQHF